MNHNFVGTEHLLLGLVRETDTMAADVLANLRVDLPKVRTAVLFIIGQGDRGVPGDIGLTPRAKKAIEFAVDEARRLNDSFIGSEHLLIGLLREGEGIAYGVLQSLGVTLERARTEVVRARSVNRRLRVPRPTSEAGPDVPLVADEQTRARSTSALRPPRSHFAPMTAPVSSRRCWLRSPSQSSRDFWTRSKLPLRRRLSPACGRLPRRTRTLRALSKPCAPKTSLRQPACWRRRYRRTPKP